MFRACKLSKAEALGYTFESATTEDTLMYEKKANTNGQVPVDLSRMMVTVSMLHPLPDR